nr:hypothetical protein CFP56_71916 [Quercus suber]POF23219.1 hypothetical protein CFP56_77774 [Quercus suber]
MAGMATTVKGKDGDGTNPESQDDNLYSFSLPEIILFRSFSSSSSDSPKTHPDPNNQPNQTAQPKLHVISPKPHISSQFYTFNPKSHSLMIRCHLKHRLATPTEIRVATPRAVLKSWRAVWKDRNEDTAYLTYAFDDKEKE